MIIDRAPLVGLDAYLRPDDSEAVNLASVPVPAVARFDATSDGTSDFRVVEVAGIDLVMRASDLSALLSRSDSRGPLLSIDTKKEVFSGLFVDPYASRVHTIGGYEDLRRGELENMRVAEVDGRPTLISTGSEPCGWQSTLYRFDRPIHLAGAAWDLAASRRTPRGAFSYGLSLDTWSPERSLSSAPDGGLVMHGSVELGPDGPRADATAQAGPVAAYRVKFQAAVGFDPAFEVRMGRGIGAGSLGRPLLRAVHLIEPYAPDQNGGASEFHFYSLSELLAACSDFSFFDANASVPTHLVARLDYEATLSEGESVTLTLHHEHFDVFEARLDATVSERPPRADKEG